MADPPPLDDMLQGAFARLDDGDVRIFYHYFEEMKVHVRRYLSGKARHFLGESHIAQSALLSLFGDLAVQEIPLEDVDADGYPMLWPLLLKYLERHCEKWKKYYRAKKRSGAEVPLTVTDPPDHRAPAGDEETVAGALDALHRKLTPRQRQVADLSAQGRTLEEIAAELNCSESLVSLEKKAIRSLLESA